MVEKTLTASDVMKATEEHERKMAEKSLKAGKKVIDAVRMVIDKTSAEWQQQEANRARAVERIRAAADMGFKPSFLIRSENLSAFRINSIVSGKTYAATGRQYGKPVSITDAEAEAINTALDKIKHSL